MSATFLANFTSGFQEAVPPALKARFFDAKVENIEDGMVIFSTSAPRDKVLKTEFLGNIFNLITSSKSIQLNQFVNEILTSANLRDSKHRGKSFRLIYSVENHLTAINTEAEKALVERISIETGLTLNKSLPDTEFWLYQRSSGSIYFLERLKHHKSFDKLLEQGELRPELAAMLCVLSEPTRSDVFLDPFCGSGAIPKARHKLGEYSRIYAGDLDELKIRKLANYFIGTPNVHLKKCDATNLADYSDNSISKIVTDPPWGIFDKVSDTEYRSLFSKTLSEFNRVLRNGGIAILLTKRETNLQDLLYQSPNSLVILKKFEILVSGKKASVWKLKKLK